MQSHQSVSLTGLGSFLDAVYTSKIVALCTMLILTAFYDAVAQRNPALARLRNHQATLDSFLFGQRNGLHRR